MGIAARIIERLGYRRLVALALAPGYLALGIDAAIAHYAAKADPVPAQMIPVITAPIGFLLILGLCLPKKPGASFVWGARILGAFSALVGGLGTFLHIKNLVHQTDFPIQWDALMQTLSVGPPVFAPAAYAGVGALLFILASPRLVLGMASAPTDSKPDDKPVLDRAA